MGFGHGGQDPVAFRVEPPVAADGQHAVFDTSIVQLSAEPVSSALSTRHHGFDTILASSMSLRGDDAHVQRRQATRGIGNAR